MIPRFHLYGDFSTWKDNIQQHEDGLWARWKDVQPYIEHCQQLNLNFDPPIPEQPEREQWVQKNQKEGYGDREFDIDADDPEFDEFDDLVDIMTKQS